MKRIKIGFVSIFAFAFFAAALPQKSRALEEMFDPYFIDQLAAYIWLVDNVSGGGRVFDYTYEDGLQMYASTQGGMMTYQNGWYAWPYGFDYGKAKRGNSSAGAEQ